MARASSWREVISSEFLNIRVSQGFIYSGGADFIFIPERPPTSDPWEDEMCEAIHRVNISSSFTQT